MKIAECNSFINYISCLIEQNPDFNITKDTIYYELSKYNIDNNKRNIKFNSLFNKWVKEYKDNPKIKVKKINNKCEFKSSLLLFNKDEKLEKPIKIYVNIDPKNMSSNIEYIINQLQKEKIYFEARVTEENRNDDLIIKIYQKKHVPLVINIIKKIKIGKANPFIPTIDEIGYSTDNKIDYNQLLSYYLFNYINDKKNAKNIYDFVKYLESKYENIFIKKDNVYNFLSSINIINNSSSRNEFLNKLDETTLEILFNLNNKKFDYGKKTNINEDLSAEKKLFNEIILTTIKKYGIGRAKKLINKYFETGSVLYIVRDNDYRKDAMLLLSPTICMKILDNMSLNEYISLLIGMDIEIIEEMSLNIAIRETYKKYGWDQSFYALKYSLLGDYRYFTNENSSKRNLLSTINREDINKILNKKFGNDLSDKDIFNYVRVITENVEKRKTNERC